MQLRLIAGDSAEEVGLGFAPSRGSVRTSTFILPPVPNLAMRCQGLGLGLGDRKLQRYYPTGSHNALAGPPRGGTTNATQRQPFSSRPTAAPPARLIRAFKVPRRTASSSASSAVVMGPAEPGGVAGNNRLGIFSTSRSAGITRVGDASRSCSSAASRCSIAASWVARSELAAAPPRR